MLKDKRVIVTGAAGVIGRELVDLLVKAGAVVLAVDRRAIQRGGNETLFAATRYLQMDLSCDNLEDLRSFQPEILFHLAAVFERAEETPAFWQESWRDNVVLSHRIVSLAREIEPLETFVFASSYLVYAPTLYLSALPSAEVKFLSEDSPVTPRNLCGAAKYYTEQEIEFLHKVLRPDLRTVCARIFRVYGFGSKDVISRWVRAALAGRHIDVYNSQNRFDFIFARDVAQGLLRLAISPRATGPVNLGSGVPRSIDDVLQALVQYLPAAASLVRDHGTKEYFEASCADLTKLRLLTGWTPVTTLEEGIGRIVEFEKLASEEQV